MRWSSFYDALRQPCIIYATDTTMALSGINKRLLATFGGECRCYISDPAWRAAKTQGHPFNGRCRYRYRRGGENKLFVFGNAPTGLCSVCLNIT
ncbi:precorrin-8X methylmutase [Salmonella enterica subsp. enterica]|nr:precorrin-8X methylmutase [Salmonella enterica subsp. enterica]